MSRLKADIQIGIAQAGRGELIDAETGGGMKLKYIIFYRVAVGGLEIIRILNAARNIDSLF